MKNNRKQHPNSSRRNKPARELVQLSRPVPVPPTTHVTIAYPFRISQSTVTGEAYQDFWANGPFDPEATGTGQQPVYFDQWMGLYQKYRVVACEYEIACVADASRFLRIAAGPIRPDGGSAPGNSVATNDVDGWAMSTNAFTTSGGDAAVIRGIVPVNKVLGISKQALLAEEDATGTSGVLPNGAFRVALCVRTSSSTASDTIRWQGRLIYHVRFERPVIQSLS